MKKKKRFPLRVEKSASIIHSYSNLRGNRYFSNEMNSFLLSKECALLQLPSSNEFHHIHSNEVHEQRFIFDHFHNNLSLCIYFPFSLRPARILHGCLLYSQSKIENVFCVWKCKRTKYDSAVITARPLTCVCPHNKIMYLANHTARNYV